MPVVGSNDSILEGISRTWLFTEYLTRSSSKTTQNFYFSWKMSVLLFCYAKHVLKTLHLRVRKLDLSMSVVGIFFSCLISIWNILSNRSMDTQFLPRMTVLQKGPRGFGFVVQSKRGGSELHFWTFYVNSINLNCH